MLFSMLRPFLSESVRDSFVFHSGDITTIRSYIRYFSYLIQLINDKTLQTGREDILPSDLGGHDKMGPMDNQHNVHELRKMEPFFREIQQFGYL